MICRESCDDSCKILKLVGLEGGFDLADDRKISNPVMDDDKMADDDVG